MIDGKLRIAPTCYHVLHQVPVMTAHELNFFYDRMDDVNSFMKNNNKQLNAQGW